VSKISENNNLSVSIQAYFNDLNKQLKKIYSLATKAREKGLDPVPEVEIPIAKDIADRVEGLIGPEGVGKKIRDYEKKNMSREQVAFMIAEDISQGKLAQGSTEELAELAIRSSLAVITESITAAPIEGIAKVKIKQNDDGSDYLAVYYAGPIRSAGGTAAGMSVLLADFVRKSLGISKYKPNQREVERYVEELELYNRVSHLQLPTTKDEQRYAAQNLPIEITGEPTDRVEVSGNRDLRRIETNRLRGGACLVFNDGLVGRAKKLQRRLAESKLEGWEWFQELIRIHEGVGTHLDEDIPEVYDISDDLDEETEEELEIHSDEGYIKDVIAGRPVFAHPSKIGGFRIRYGRSRTTGLAGMGIHPALMGLTDDFLACGTHVRTERPGKGAIVMPVDSLHPPIIKLKNGDVVEVNSYKEANNLKKQLQEILFLGDMLYGVGEFNQNSHDLVPSGYCEEWWVQELESSFKEVSSKDKEVLSKGLVTKVRGFIKDPFSKKPSPEEAFAISKVLSIPLHPEYTYHWSNLTLDEYNLLRKHIVNDVSEDEQDLIISFDEVVKEILERIFIPHKIVKGKIEFGPHSKPLLVSLGIQNGKLAKLSNSKDKVLDAINSVSDLEIREKCSVYTGARMGRPEKAKDRRMRPPVQLLFPIEDKGGRLRDLYKAAEKKKISIDLTQRICPQCGELTDKSICSSCKVKAIFVKRCDFCKINLNDEKCSKCGREAVNFTRTSFPIGDRVSQAKHTLGGPLPKNVKAVKKLMNKDKMPELIEKGILRAKHDIFVYRDGTIRFDSTDAILTHFKPKEVGVKVQKLHELGYSIDVVGKPLERVDQTVELKIQDVIVNDDGGKHLLKVANYIDDLLEKVYGLPRFYNATTRTDLIGKIIIGLAPHTSAGIVGRIVGFTKAKVNFAHPYWHAAKRRNCLSSKEEIIIWDTERQQLSHKEIGEIVESLISEGANREIVDDFGTITVENLYPNWKVVSMNEEAKLPLLQPIKHWIKGESNTWIKIRTETGRTLTVTPDHNMLVWNGTSEMVTKTKARFLEVGDSIPIVNQPPIPIIEPPHRISILREFAENLPDTKKFQQFKHQVRLRNAKGWLKEKLWQFISKEYEIEQTSTNRIPTKIKQSLIAQLPTEPIKNPLDFNWYNSIPLSHLEVLQRKGIFEWDEIPENSFLGMARDDHIVGPYIDFNKDLVRLIGYLISEGYIRDENTCYQTNFSVPNPDLRKHVKQLIIDTLESEPYYKKDNHQLVHTGRIHAYLFAYAFGIGKDAYTKRVPSFIFSLPDHYKYDFISALIDGDGSVPSVDSNILYYSVSEKLLTDITLLLNTLGVFCRIRKPSPIGHYGERILKRYEELQKSPKRSVVHKIAIRGPDLWILEHLSLHNQEKKNNVERMIQKGFTNRRIIKKPDGNYSQLEEYNGIILDSIYEIDVIKKKEPSYCLTVDLNHSPTAYSNFSTINCLTVNCDGDEDSLILALDAFLNFSKFYLPEIRGGKMDAPLILVANLNPHEVDDESHNVDTSLRYPLSFYEASLAGSSPKTVLPLIDMIQNRLDNQTAYEGFHYSHETSHIFDGPSSTAYKNLTTMEDKVNAQLKVAEIIRAVDVTDVATRIIVNHFIPDLIGNLRRFGSQKFRCTKCNRTYRRIPLSETCPNCNQPNLNLTVFEKSITKYFDMAHNLVNKYNLSEYLKNRLDIIKHNVDSLFTESPPLTTKKDKSKKGVSSKIDDTVKLSDYFIKPDTENKKD
jgi:DNA polymerase II large subunit